MKEGRRGNPIDALADVQLVSVVRGVHSQVGRGGADAAQKVLGREQMIQHGSAIAPHHPRHVVRVKLIRLFQPLCPGITHGASPDGRSSLFLGRTAGFGFSGSGKSSIIRKVRQ